MLTAEEVLPEKIAGAEESGQERKRFLVAQKGQGFLPGLALRLLNGEIEKLVEGFQGLGRVRSPSECVGELLDEDSRQAQLLLLGRVGELLAAAIAYSKSVMQLAAFEVDAGCRDVYVAHRQGIGEGIEEGGRVVRSDIHGRVGRRLAVVERNLDRMQQAAE